MACLMKNVFQPVLRALEKSSKNISLSKILIKFYLKIFPQPNVYDQEKCFN